MSPHTRTLSLILSTLVAGLFAPVPLQAGPITLITGQFDIVTHTNTPPVISMSGGTKLVAYSPVPGGFSTVVTFNSVTDDSLHLDPAKPGSVSFSSSDPLMNFVLTKVPNNIPFGVTGPGKLAVDPANFQASVTFPAVLKLPPGDPSGGITPPPVVDFGPLFGPNIVLFFQLNNLLINFTDGATPSYTITDKPGATPIAIFRIQAATVPEPASVVLWSLGAVAAGALVRLRRWRRQPHQT
jgi:hypothetical protein